MEDYTKVSLKDLFNQNKKAHVDTKVGVVDGSITNIPEINLGEFEGSYIQKDEGVMRVDKRQSDGNFYGVGTMSYGDYIRKSKEDQIQQEIDQLTDSIRRVEILEELFEGIGLMGLEAQEFMGYNKLGVNREGEPYIEAMLSNQFERLNTRRFLTEEEFDRVVNTNGSYSESEAVVNKSRSIREMITLNIKKKEDLEVLTISIKDGEGVRIPYLEQKLDYIRELGVSPHYWVIYLKTKFEFEEDYDTLEELIDVEFNM